MRHLRQIVRLLMRVSIPHAEDEESAAEDIQEGVMLVD